MGKPQQNQNDTLRQNWISWQPAAICLLSRNSEENAARMLYLILRPFEDCETEHVTANLI